MKKIVLITAAAVPLLALGLSACSSDPAPVAVTSSPAPVDTSAAPSESAPASSAAPTESALPSDSASSSASGSTAAGTYSLADVATHATATDCWTAVGSNVYDITAWIPKHPGGPTVVTALCGIDGTLAYSGAHAGNGEADAALATFQIGTLSDAAASTDASTGASAGASGAAGSAAAVPTGVTSNPDTNPAAVTLANQIVDTKMTLVAAEKAIKDANFESRVIFINGEGQIATMDYRPDRFNLVIEGDTGSEIVTGITFG